MPDIYKYRPSIDSKIIVAVQEVLHVPVVYVEKIKKGEINHVYKVATARGTVIARVFRYKKWPEDGKLEWIEQQLSKHRVPHAKILYYKREAKYFPNGFMLSEFIDGVSGTEAVVQKIITEAELYTAFGTLTRKIHRVRTEKFGPLNQGRGKYDNYVQMQIDGALDILRKLRAAGALKTNYTDPVTKCITTAFKGTEQYIHPCLLHGDLSESNTIVTKNKKVYLIDWDNARSGFWLADFIELTRRHVYDETWSNNQQRMHHARTAFFLGYGKIPFSTSQLRSIENALQVIRHIWQMNYYQFDNVSPADFKRVYQIFKKLLLPNKS
ncbi:MAG: aminoglycoside phosphotransferase family protein [Candidatus Doudnabacteria bacterium]|nr:aminoglycoside phosphotransferase family protein [Candidatus Doudnabacteria bacterium]